MRNIGATTYTYCTNGTIASSQLTTVLVPDYCVRAHSIVLWFQLQNVP